MIDSVCECMWVYFFCLYKFVYHLYRLLRVYASEVRSSLSVWQHQWKWSYAFTLLSFGPFTTSAQIASDTLFCSAVINFGLTSTLRTPPSGVNTHTHTTTNTRWRPKRTKEHKRETKTRESESTCAGDEGATKRTGQVRRTVGNKRFGFIFFIFEIFYFSFIVFFFAFGISSLFFSSVFLHNTFVFLHSLCPQKEKILLLKTVDSYFLLLPLVCLTVFFFSLHLFSAVVTNDIIINVFFH